VYAELHALSNFSFLRGASRPEELVTQAAKLGYKAITIADECSLAGVVKAHVAARDCGIKLIIGSEFIVGYRQSTADTIKLVLLAPNKAAYGELSALITLARRRSIKGEYRLAISDLNLFGKSCLAIWLPDNNSGINSSGINSSIITAQGEALQALFPDSLWLGITKTLAAGEQHRHLSLYTLARQLNIPMVACGDIHMHCPARKPLQDALTAIRLNTSVDQLGTRLQSNSEHHLRSVPRLQSLYPRALLHETLKISERCSFSLDELRYQYPREVVPKGSNPHTYLRQLTMTGARQRWPEGIPEGVISTLERELSLIREMQYEYYFLTVYDIVRFARRRNILCQGRGSAANSVVCYCLFITEVSPTRVALLFERFISKERDEPPDIDVDFEHERREEVIQYIYKKYTRERAALAATVITYRIRSAVRDIGKALGLSPIFIDQLAKSLAWWDRQGDLQQRFKENHLPDHEAMAQRFFNLVQEILGFPRHLSQHVGGFIITEGPISQLVPVENASMPERTVIQWDKEDIETLGLMKVDVLALGMLSAIRKCLELMQGYGAAVTTMQAVPEGDTATYDMLCAGDSIGVFQVESRAQISMLPRLRPRCYYDLVIQVAIVRPGPIQGDMVHPYLKRRDNPETVTYPSAALKEVLKSTLGIPIFQEQVIKLAMVAAGFSGGEADQLRRAMASWGKNGNLMKFETKLVNGMLERGYQEDFAHRLFNQIKGFGGYGFPESHSASFALLAYVSSWLKCHHPAAFYCALLNSQPMGFYSPSQLVQDARRHNISIRPVDVVYSSWDHRLELPLATVTEARQPALRLGLRLVKGLTRAAGMRIETARSECPFADLPDLIRRAQLDKKDREALASANALRHFSPHRHQANWQILGIEPPRPLLDSKRSTNKKTSGNKNYPGTEESTVLSSPSTVEDMLADYQTTGLTLGSHPMALLRKHSVFRGCKRQSELVNHGNKRFVRIAGLVTGRQRPGSASGVVFLTLEDETGNINVIVWKDLQQRFRQALLSSKLLLVKGIMECKNEVIHVIAGELIDCSEVLEELTIKSRDFH
jgi:error-prone DNA polymerase